MSYDEFVQTWTGRGADFDGWYGDQCVDLFNFYNRDVVGAPHIGTPLTGGAADLWTNFANSPAVRYYDRLPNSATFVPRKGDVGVWAANTKATGPAGHVGMCNGVGDTSFFDSFDQNYPTGSLPHFQRHSYDGFYGVLRPKYNQGDSPMTSAEKDQAYKIVLGRPPENPAADGRTAMQFILDAQGELNDVRAARAATTTALQAEVASSKDALTKASATIADLKQQVVAAGQAPASDAQAVQTVVAKANPLVSFLAQVWAALTKKG